ncbi:hypothetical protein AKJ16_DCAP16356, partial [Drosera capensis]
MVDLKERFDMMLEKSGTEPSGSGGRKPRSRQTSTQRRSKVWPEETTTGRIFSISGTFRFRFRPFPLAAVKHGAKRLESYQHEEQDRRDDNKDLPRTIDVLPHHVVQLPLRCVVVKQVRFHNGFIHEGYVRQPYSSAHSIPQ